MGLMPVPVLHTRSRGHAAAIVLQCLLLLAAGTLAFVPPARGQMLILPLYPGDDAATAIWAVDASARLIAPGPYPGAWYVDGARSTLAGAALRRGALLVNTRFAGCSEPDREALRNERA